MIRQALSFLFPRKPRMVELLEAERRAHQALIAELQAERSRAAFAYLNALDRRDTRDQHVAHREFVRATNACLRVEGMH